MHKHYTEQAVYNFVRDNWVALAWLWRGEVRKKRVFEEEGEALKKREKHQERGSWSHQCVVTSISMNLSLLNLGANLSSIPFLDLDPARPSFDDPDPGGNGEESHTSLEEELEVW
ncbi:unnamed protein product [Musa textilis]